MNWNYFDFMPKAQFEKEQEAEKRRKMQKQKQNRKKRDYCRRLIKDSQHNSKTNCSGLYYIENKGTEHHQLQARLLRYIIPVHS
ncbi:MAG: hypothetical protein IPF68_06570 [Bacteroidales bacterium]|nr:hypothetical protein [Bacteroidales bacterium]